MFKILFVDDEYLELQMLVKHIDWNSFGFSVSGTALNGQEALAHIHSQAPDVLITDIKMPIMDGIELASVVHQEFPDIAIVFLTGYNQFEYLKSAFSVDAVDYLLKPISFDEVPALMAKIFLKCQQVKISKQTLYQSAFSTIQNAIVQKRTSLTAEELYFLNQGIYPGSPQLYLALAVISEYELITNYMDDGPSILQNCHHYLADFSTQYHAIQIPLSKDHFLLLSDIAISPKSRDWQDADQGIWVTVCCRAEPVSRDKILSTCYELDELRHQYVTNYPSKPIIYESEMHSALLPEPSFPGDNILNTTQLLQYLQTRDIPRTAAWVDNFLSSQDFLKDSNLLLHLLDYIYSNLVQPSAVLRESTESKADLYRKFMNIESRSVLKSLLLQYLYGLMDLIEQSQEDPSLAIVEQVKSFIRASFSQPFTIETLAEKFYFSPNYLSSLFKKYSNETILEYLTQVRLEKAVELLKDPQYKISQIASVIGYSNASYFCMLFTKKYGLSPNQYRSRYIE